MNSIELSKKALSNTEKLIEKYVIESKNKNGDMQQKVERNKLTDEFTIALNALICLMTDTDKNIALELLRRYGILKAVKRSVRRVQYNKSLAFT